MNCFRFANAIKDTLVINIFKSDNSSITKTKTQNYHVMKTMIYRILKFQPMIEKPMVTNYTFFTVITFNNINSFTWVNSIVMQLRLKIKINAD